MPPDVESVATTDCLEQALLKPQGSPRRGRLQSSAARTRARFQQLAEAELKLRSKPRA